MQKDKLVEERAAEVGNIFTLGNRYTKAHNFTYTNEKGEEQEIVMGCYGIGPGRLMGAVVEVLSDDKGIIWPETIAPFTLHLLVLGEDKAVRDEAEKTFKTLVEAGVEVLFDDRSDISPGEKFADADLLGVPYRAVVSARSIKENGIEIKKRTEEKGKIVTVDELIGLLVTKN